MLSGCVDIINTMDKIILDTLEQQVKEVPNLNKVDQKVGEVDQWVEILEESCHHYQEFILADQQRQRMSNQEITSLYDQIDQLLALERGVQDEMQLMGEVIGTQTHTINTQNKVLAVIERKVDALQSFMVSQTT